MSKFNTNIYFFRKKIIFDEKNLIQEKKFTFCSGSGRLVYFRLGARNKSWRDQDSRMKFDKVFCARKEDKARYIRYQGTF